MKNKRIRGEENHEQKIQSLWISIWRILNQIKKSSSYMNLAQDRAILLLGICSKGSTSYSTDMCSHMSIAVISTIATKWEPPNCPATDRQIMKKRYIHTMEYYLLNCKEN